MFPTFTINRIIKNDKGLELTGSLSSDSYNDEKWVDDKWVGFIKENDSLVDGRWHKHNSDWKFVVKQEDVLGIDFYIGQKVTVIDGYWGERVELVIDKNIDWKETAYKAKDNNDHDHCFICWATISEFENKEYLLGNDRASVCLNCFKNYIKQDSLDFILSPKK